MAKPKTPGPKKPQPRPLAQKVRAMMREVLGAKVVDFSAARAARDAAATLHETVPKDRTLAWLGFFERNVPKVRARDAAQAFELLMKYGLGPSYWNKYIFEAYADHDDQAIWLRGLPDVAESRPHAPKFDPSFRFPGEPARRS